MNIGTDLDCVLADFQSAMVEFHNETFKTDLKLDDFWTFNYHKIWGGTPEQGLAKMEEFYKTNYFSEIIPMPGSVEVIKKLAANNKIFIVTSRVPTIEKLTHVWVEKHFQGLISGIYFSSNNYTPIVGRSRKADYCLSLNLDYLIEDDPGYAGECHSDKTRVVLMDQPWNRGEQFPEGITRVRSWTEILKIIESESRGKATKQSRE